jgi:DNA adenine methylase
MTGHLERAWAFLVVAHQGFRTKHPRLQLPSGYAGLRKPNRCIQQWLELPDTLAAFADRFRTVQLERLDFREVIRRYDAADTMFIIDPPYYPTTRPYRYYKHEMSHDDHVELLEMLITVKGKVWLCGYDHPVYRTMLKRWRKENFRSRSPHYNRAPRTEVVWTNFIPLSNSAKSATQTELASLAPFGATRNE